MIYGFSPHPTATTEHLKAAGVPCRRKDCGCVPYDHKVHSKKAREARVDVTGLEPMTSAL